jgi:xanthine dehydrogenase molybdenum-binding subunit
LKAKAQLLKKAAPMLDVSADELEVREGVVFLKSDQNKQISVADVCEHVLITSGGESDNICGTGKWSPSTNAPPFAAYFAEVEVNMETGTVRLIKLLTAGDVGKPLNPMTVEGHFEGCMQMFAGYGLTEDWTLNKKTGQLETNNFATYKMLSQLDMPETEVILIDNPDPTGPFGAKGAGELGGAGIASAIANAVYDAVGVRINDLPVTPEKIINTLKSK